jgi:hypothetical protein
MSLEACEQFTTDAPALSAAAVRLVLELQLLAAGAMQRQQQQHGSSGQQAAGPPGVLLLHCNTLLQAQISALAQTGSNGVLAQLLQQHGLRLLQSLAAPVQQLQLRCSDNDVYVQSVEAALGDLPEQLSVLRAASSGLHASTSDDITGGIDCGASWMHATLELRVANPGLGHKEKMHVLASVCWLCCHGMMPCTMSQS